MHLRFVKVNGFLLVADFELVTAGCQNFGIEAHLRLHLCKMGSITQAIAKCMFLCI